MIAVAFLHAGLLTLLAAVLSLLKPLRFLGIRTRRTAALLLVPGLLLAAVGQVLPAPEQRVPVPHTRLDEFIPVYQFHEVHTTRVKASSEHVYLAIREVTAREILLFRTLTWLRRFGRPAPEGILNAPEHLPLLEVAVRTSFLELAAEPDHEIVIGTLVMAPAGWRPQSRPTPAGFQALDAPGFAKAAMNFRVEQAGPGVVEVITETRVYATDLRTCRRFAAYWRVIYPGSALLRRTWLRAIRLRAEAMVANS
jgi:hypothetical protein